jgi:hypothetical protein
VSENLGSTRHSADPVSQRSSPTVAKKIGWPWLVLHGLILLNFAVEILYCGYMIFFVLAPPGGAVGPLWGGATAMPFEQLSVRRMYAHECWVALVGLCLYLAVTEIGPRLRRARGE